MSEKKYLGVAVSDRGNVFLHPADGTPEADAAARARGDFPYTHLYEGDNVLDVIPPSQPATSYSHRATVAELRAWLAQFQPGDEVFIGGTPVSGYIEAGERVFALYDEEKT